jgi:hypothetical protein
LSKHRKKIRISKDTAEGLLAVAKAAAILGTIAFSFKGGSPTTISKTRDIADAAIMTYVNATFLPGTLKLPITSVCPQPAPATTTTGA